MSLQAFVRSYCLSRDCTAAWRKQIEWTARNFETWLGRPATVDDFTDELVNFWLEHLAAKGLARITIRGYRIALLVLWNAAWADGKVCHPPRRVRRIQVPRMLPQAWTPDEMKMLLSQAERVLGRFKFSKVWRAKFWRAFVLTAWDSGLRLGDLQRLRRSDIDQSGLLAVEQRKTGYPLLAQLYPATVRAIDATFPPQRPLIFGGVISRRMVFVYFRELATGAGLTGGTKKIRKSGATAVEGLVPGAGMLHLGHRTPDLAARFYLDARLLQRNKPMPPPIAG